MAADEKDTIYIDLDDEITVIIDKLRASDKKIVALVLPKRAAVLQSIVNMKLLKRAADQANKNVVLVTTESGLLPLAGAVGLHVAKTPTSRPEVPAAPGAPSDAEEQVNEDDPLIAQAAANMPIGVLAGDAAATADETDGTVPVRKSAAGDGDAASRKTETMPLPPSKSAAGAAEAAGAAAAGGIETVEFDNAAREPEAPLAAAGAPKLPKPKKDKKLSVPNFEKFRLIAIVGVVVILLLVFGGIWAFAIAPHATITVKTDASQINTNVNFTLDTTADSLSGSTVPAKEASTQKTFTGNAQSTGQVNNGDKATGSVTMEACLAWGASKPSIPSGTGITDGSLVYVTQKSVSSNSWSSDNSGGDCSDGDYAFKSNNVSVIAQKGGTSYNDSTISGTVNGYPAVTASGSADGGTDSIETVVSQTDIENAQKNINVNGGTQQQDLQDQLQNEGLYPITATYVSGTPNVTSSSQVGDQASSVTVTETVTYTMFGASKQDLKNLVDQNIKSQISGDQGILDEGITQAAFKMTNTTANGASMNLQTTAEVGPSINVAQVAQDAAGQKTKDIEAQLQNNPDVTSVSVKLSPFWVTTAPKNVKKITVTIAKPTNSND